MDVGLQRRISPAWLWACLTVGYVPVVGALLRWAFWVRVERLEEMCEGLLQLYFRPAAAFAGWLGWPPPDPFRLGGVLAGVAVNTTLVLLAYWIVRRVARRTGDRGDWERVGG